MKILVVSDLHIDTHDESGIFKWNETKLIMQMEYIRDLYSIDKVIFNGDIFELYKYSFDEIRKANPNLIEYLKNKDFVFIKGNHDLISDFGKEYFQIINSHGQSIYIEHGHSADWLNGNKTGRAVIKFGLSLLKKFPHSKSLKDFYFRKIATDDFLNHTPKKYNTIKYLTYALRLLKEHDVVFLAHTHKLESHHTYYMNKKKRYLNSGACSMGRFQAIVMDTESLKYELIKDEKNSMENINLMKCLIEEAC